MGCLKGDVWFAVVGDEVDAVGVTEALAVVVDDGLAAISGEAAEAHDDAVTTEIARGFVADFLEREGVINSDFSRLFEEEEFLVELGVLEEAGEVKVEAEAVDGFHTEGAVLAVVVGVFDPLTKGVVEGFEAGDVGEISYEELVSDGAEEAFDFPFGGSVAHGGVEENGAEAGADLSKLFGFIVASVVGVDGFGDAPFIEGELEAVDEVFGVVGGVELTVWDDA